jgi:hypothetical protein
MTQLFTYTYRNPETDYRNTCTVDAHAETIEAGLASIRRFVGRLNRRFKAAGMKPVPTPKLSSIKREG